MSLAQNIARVQQQIAEQAQACGRNPNDVTLVAVSKFQDVAHIEEAYACGLRDFGESYTQEWKVKAQQLAHLPDIRWHLIGHLQKNKVKDLNDRLFCLQSLDSLALAIEIEKKARFAKKLPVLVQLQIDPNDANKSGIPYADASALCDFVCSSQNLELHGFMGIGPLDKPHELKTLYERFFAEGNTLWQQRQRSMQTNKCVFSLGMSEDMSTAIACGSTMVRVGRAIFGERRRAH